MLDSSALSSDLEALFTGAPFLEPDCAQKWADAMQTYAGSVVPPANPGMIVAGAAAMKAALAGFSAQGAAAAKLETAFLAFGAQVGAAIATAGTFVSKSPTSPVGFAQLFNSTYPTPSAAASAISASIHAWMITGQSAPVPPGTAFVPWS